MGGCNLSSVALQLQSEDNQHLSNFEASPLKLRRVAFTNINGAVLELSAAAEVGACIFANNSEGLSQTGNYRPCMWAGPEGNNLVLRDSIFRDNRCPNLGVFNRGYDGDNLMEVTNCSFVSNVGTALRVHRFAMGDMTPLRGSVLFANVTIINSQFVSNTARTKEYGGFVGLGGAIHASGGLYGSGQVHVDIYNSSFTRNQAVHGGAVAALDGACITTVQNTTFTGNKAEAFGGGVYSVGCNWPSSRWVHVTMHNNSAGIDGGGLHLADLSSKQSVYVANSSFVGNEAEGGSGQSVDSELRASPSACGAGAKLGLGGAMFLGGASVQMLDLNFERNRAAGSGGAVYVCMQQGELGMGVPDATFMRVNATQNQAGSLGLGATAGADTDEGTEGGAVHVVGQYVVALFAHSRFTGNTAGRGGAISWGVVSGVLIMGCSNNTADPRLAPLTTAGLMHQQASADGWLLGPICGVFRGNVATAADGGAVAASTPPWQAFALNVVAQDNAAMRGGGAFSFWGDAASSLVAINATVSNNTAAFVGGGLVVGGQGVNVTVQNSTLDRNQVDGSGGGLFCQACSGPRLVECTFQQNMAHAAGGGMACHQCESPSLVNSTFDRNGAGVAGGGAAFWLAQGSVVLNRSAFANNRAAVGLDGLPKDSASGGGPAESSTISHGKRLLVMARRQVLQGGQGGQSPPTAQQTRATSSPPGGRATSPPSTLVYSVDANDIMAATFNATGDLAYQGGGGVYVWADNATTVFDTLNMTGNIAANGGEEGFRV